MLACLLDGVVVLMVSDNKFACRFHLYYYSGTVTKASSDTKLIIDTRGSTKPPPAPTLEPDPEDEESEDPMERAIQTKYDNLYNSYLIIINK